MQAIAKRVAAWRVTAILGIAGVAWAMTSAAAEVARTPVLSGSMVFDTQSFDWTTAKMVHPSILRTAFEVTQPRLMKGSCVRVDLADKTVRFHATGRDKDWGKPMPDYPDKPHQIRTRRETARSFMLSARKPVAEGGKGLNMLVAVNCSPFSPWVSPWNHKYADHTGLIVSEGAMVAPPTGYPSCVVYKDGRVTFKKIAPSETITDIQTAVSGFGIIMTNNIILANNNPADLHPRTGFGLSKDKRYLYFFVVDGRQPEYSMGASTYEVAEWLRYFGADSAMNMDGGGSTTLFCWDPTPDPENTDPKSRATPHMHKLNRQKDNAERPLGCTLGISCSASNGDQN